MNLVNRQYVNALCLLFTLISTTSAPASSFFLTVPCLTGDDFFSDQNMSCRTPPQKSTQVLWEDESFLNDISGSLAPDKPTKFFTSDDFGDEEFINSLLDEILADDQPVKPSSPAMAFLADQLETGLNDFQKVAEKKYLKDSDSWKRHGNIMLAMMRAFIFAASETVNEYFEGSGDIKHINSSSWAKDVPVFATATGSVAAFYLAYEYLTAESLKQRILEFAESILKREQKKCKTDTFRYKIVERAVFLFLINNSEEILQDMYSIIKSEPCAPLEETVFGKGSWNSFKSKIYSPNLSHNSLLFMGSWFRLLDRIAKKAQTAPDDDEPGKSLQCFSCFYY